MQRSRFFFLCAIEGAIPVVALLLIPSEGGTLSLARLALLSSILALIIIWIYCGFSASNILDRLIGVVPILGAALLSLAFSMILFLLRYLNPEALLSIYERLSPLLWYLLVLSIQFTMYLLYLKNGIHFSALRQNKSTHILSIVVFGILLLIFIFISATKIGITKDPAYWGEPGVPILGWQFLLAIIAGGVVVIWQLGSPPSSTLERLLPLGLYLSACGLWLSVPVESLRNSFYAPITLPFDTTPLPYSDAGFYDYLSQSLLIGSKYFGSIPPRPLYVIFLALGHFLFGQTYIRIVAFQTIVLAFFPVALYKLGAKLHSPAAGVTIALFAIFRELTTLWVSGEIRTASTKIFVTDFATSMGIALVALVIIHWLERRDFRSSLVAGGSYGLLLLLRTQSLIILPFVFVLAWFAFQRKAREWLIACVIFGITMTMTITPWLVHNRKVTGRFTFDDPKQMAVIYSQYSFTGNLDLSQFNFETDSVGNRLISFTRANPGFVGWFIANHFLDTEVGSVLAMPMIERYNGLLAAVNIYWLDWAGDLDWYNIALVLFYLGVIAIGIAATWKRFKWIGLTPLVFNLAYALANGISRFSSWRYNLPVDWVAYFYFGIGVIEMITWGAMIFGAQVSPLVEDQTDHSLAPKPIHALMVAGFVLIGSMPWLVEGLTQPRYTTSENDLRRQAITQSGEAARLLSQPDTQIINGRLLYPRFFRKNDGIFSGNPWPVYEARDFSRLSFLVINDAVHSVIFAVNKPIPFVHGADVMIAGCQHADFLEARWIYFPDSKEIYQSENVTDACVP